MTDLLDVSCWSCWTYAACAEEREKIFRSGLSSEGAETKKSCSRVVGRINVADPISRRPSTEHPTVSLNVLTRALKKAAEANASARSSAPAPASANPEKAAAQAADLQPLADSESSDMDVDASTTAEVSETAALRKSIIEGYNKDPWFAEAGNLRNLHRKHEMWWRHSTIAIPDHAGLRQKLLHEIGRAHV